MKLCCIDTEFNAFDYKGQNDFLQEVVEIGCVVVQDDGTEAQFARRCRLMPGHTLTRRCTQITGLQEADIADAEDFPTVLMALRAFVKENGALNRIYALGKEDRTQLLRTAEEYPLGKKQVAFIRNVVPADQEIADVIGRPSASMRFSLAEICEICGVENEDVHSALGDAQALAHCMNAIRERRFDAALAEKLAERKVYHSQYMQQRRIRDAAGAGMLDETGLSELERLICGTELGDAQCYALIDDLRCLFGYEERYEFFR